MRKVNPLKSMTTKQLWDELRDCLTMTVNGIRRSAELLHELSERGEDISRFKIGILAMLPLVANGALLPEIVVNYAHTPEIVEAIATLVPEEQRTISDPGASLPVARRKADGDIMVSTPRVADLSPGEIRRVFEGGRIRTPEEQAKSLPAALIRALPSRHDPDGIDVSAYTRRKPGQGERVTVQTEYTRKQYEAIARRAKKAGMTVPVFLVDHAIRTLRLPQDEPEATPRPSRRQTAVPEHRAAA